MKKAKFGINQQVNIKSSFTNCKSGVITQIEIRYIVKQTDGMAFWYEENKLEKTQ